MTQRSVRFFPPQVARRGLSWLGLGTLALLGLAGCSQHATSTAGETAPEATATRAEALAGPQTPVTYQYDKLGRLRSAEYPSATKRIRVDYDKAGNRTQSAIDQTITNADAAAP